MDIKQPTAIIIDFEFTGLDNTYTTDNEIIQFKAMNMDNGKTFCKNYSSKKALSAYSQLTHRVERYEGVLFSDVEFIKGLKEIDVFDYTCENLMYFGYGVNLDELMLSKIGISNIFIYDIKELIQLSVHEERLAKEGGNMETAYFIVTGKYPELKSHDGIEELTLIAELYMAASKLEKKEFLTVMPFGHCAGMPLTQYVELYRKQADGYRFNNEDILAESLTNTIEIAEENIQNQFLDEIHDEHDGIDE